MSESSRRNRLRQAIVAAAATVVVLAGLKLAADIIVPFLLSAFIALLCSAPLFWLNKKGVPNGISVLIVVLGLLSIGVVLGITVGSSLNIFTKRLPEYKASLQQQFESVIPWLAAQGIDVSTYRESVTSMFDPSSAMGMVGKTLKTTSAVLTNGFMILLTVIFILLEAMGMPNKLNRMLSDPQKTFDGIKVFVHSVNQYLLIKTIVSAVTGILAGICTAALGVDFPILWGVLAFAFNFVPTIGSIIAAVPPILLGVVQLGPGAILSVGACYLVINILMGNVVEPRITGQGLGLSTLVVFFSLVFWGWLLGPVGMLLSVPLTMIVKIACESNDSTKAIGILLGPANAGD